MESNIFYYFFFLYTLNPGNDLDSIRALFSEKEKELSLAVAKVEALTKQLEELRRDRRGPLNLISTAGAALNPTNAAATVNSLNINGSNNGTNNIQQHLNSTSPAARELDKLRRELMVFFLVSMLNKQTNTQFHDNKFFVCRCLHRYCPVSMSFSFLFSEGFSSYL